MYFVIFFFTKKYTIQNHCHLCSCRMETMPAYFLSSPCVLSSFFFLLLFHPTSRYLSMAELLPCAVWFSRGGREVPAPWVWAYSDHFRLLPGYSCHRCSWALRFLLASTIYMDSEHCSYTGGRVGWESRKPFAILLEREMLFWSAFLAVSTEWHCFPWMILKRLLPSPVPEYAENVAHCQAVLTGALKLSCP